MANSAGKPQRMSNVHPACLTLVGREERLGKR